MNIAVYRGTYSFLSVFTVFASFLADITFKTKLKKIVLVADEIMVKYVGRRRPMKVTSFPTLCCRLPLTDGNNVFVSDVHISADENNFLNSTK
jgi:hypothetical protein